MLLYYNTVAQNGSFDLLTGLRSGGPTVLKYSDELQALQVSSVPMRYEYVGSSLISTIRSSLFLLDFENAPAGLR